ncbi:OprO/OprP family phosphate-selective porin [Phenylobacterium glaciei]|uniref:OprO/OprP family phosphate-selective porin n=1 Tax=Phenylobacterium glaciei TaxID=2803784 RepID=UPI003222093F
MTGLVLAWPGLAAADPVTDAKIAALEEQLALLQAQIADLKVSTSASISALRSDATTTSATIANGKPTIATPDGTFSATLHGVMQLDTAKYDQDDRLPAAVTARDLSGGANFRRARIGVDGKVFGNFDYNILFEFGGSGAEDAGRVQELWLQYSGLKPLRFRIGAFAPPLGLEDAASVNGSLFPERPAVADIARGLAGADTRIGGGVIGNGDHWFASAIATGPLVQSLNSGATAFNAPIFDEQQGYALRVAGMPLHGFDWLVHVGANASIVAQPTDLGASAGTRYALQLRERPELRVDGTRLVDTGQIDAKGAQAYGLELAAQKQNLLIQGEYFDISLDRRNPAVGASDPSFNGWYVEGSWVLTGERRKYNIGAAAFDAPGVDKPFDPSNGQWGAWELAARYSTIDLNYAEDSLIAADRVRGGQQDIWTLGVNWFPNPAVKFMLDYYDVSVDRKNTTGAAIGQDYRALNLRSQIAF